MGREKVSLGPLMRLAKPKKAFGRKDKAAIRFDILTDP